MKPLSYLLLMLLFLIAGFLAGVAMARGPEVAAGLLAAGLSVCALGMIAIGRWWMDARREGELKTENGGTEN
jgi:hypothetical protein